MKAPLCPKDKTVTALPLKALTSETPYINAKETFGNGNVTIQKDWCSGIEREREFSVIITKIKSVPFPSCLKCNNSTPGQTQRLEPVSAPGILSLILNIMCAALNLIRGVHLVEHTFQVSFSPVRFHTGFNNDQFHQLPLNYRRRVNNSSA